jgi:hypothetical protein
MDLSMLAMHQSLALLAMKSPKLLASLLLKEIMNLRLLNVPRMMMFL